MCEECVRSVQYNDRNNGKVVYNTYMYMYNYLHQIHSTLSTLTRVVRERESTNNDALFISMLLIQYVDST